MGTGVPEAPGRQARHHGSHAAAGGWENSVGFYSPDHEARLREYANIVRPARTEQSCPD